MSSVAVVTSAGQYLHKYTILNSCECMQCSVHITNNLSAYTLYFLYFITSRLILKRSCPYNRVLYKNIFYVYRYVFTSKADEERHIQLVHGGKRGVLIADRDPGDRVQQHQCKVCNEVFPTRYQLTKHQKAKEHKLPKGRPQLRRN